MKVITGETLVKRLVTLRGKLLYAHERGGDCRLHGALNSFEREATALEGAEVAFASANEADYASTLWNEVHALALKAFFHFRGTRRVHGLTVPLCRFGVPGAYVDHMGRPVADPAPSIV